MSRRSRRTRTSSGGGPDIDPADLERYLDKYTDSLSGDPLGLTSDDTFSDLCAMVRTVPTATLGLVPRLFDLVLSNLDALPTTWTATINADAPLDHAKMCLTRWLDLMQQLVISAEHRSMHIQSVNQANGTGGAVAATGRGGRPPARKRAKHVSTDEAEWDWETLKLRTFNTLHRVLALPLNHDLTDAERNEAVSHVAKAVAELWQNKDRTSLKNATVKQVMYKVYAQCIVEHGFDAQVALEQNIKFFDFLAEPTAEFLAYLVRDHNHSKLASDMLVSIAKGDSLGTDGGKHVKSIAIFLTSLANLVPRIVQKSLVYLQDQLDNPDYTMRIAVLHCVASTLRLLIDPALAGEAEAEGDVPAGEADLDLEGEGGGEEDDEAQDSGESGGNRMSSRVQSLLQVIEDRFRDITAQVRKKALVVVSDLVDYRYFYARFPTAWLRLVGLAVGRLMDKNQPVRAAAIRAVTQFLVRHPFTIHGTSLDPAKLQPMADEVFAQKQEMMKQLEENPGSAHMDNKLADALHVREKYFSHALQFTNTIETKAVPALVQLLASKSKAEVLESMDFFVEAQGLDLPGGIEGLRNMWMLVFNVRNSEHIKDVHAKLVECFRAVYIVGRDVSAPALAEDEAGPTLVGADATVRNLITLTYSASLADLTCLEQLVGMCAKEGHIESRVVDTLWNMLESGAADRRVPAKQRRGAAIVLAWVCRADSKLLGADQVSIVNRTLRTHSRDAELARYCCQILGHLPTRLPASYHLFEPLVNALVAPAPETVDPEIGDPWYSMAQQAIVTIHRICQQPLQIMDRVIRTRANELSTSTPVAEPVLCRFFFVLGHAAIQSLVFLEAIESMYKQKQGAAPNATAPVARTPARTPARATPGRRMSRHSRTPAAARSGNHVDGHDSDKDMDGVVGSVEDVFADNMTALREFELLSGSNSLLGVFVPFVLEVVSSSITPPTVRQFATITLAQFMCVSGGFCEDHLPLLIAVMQSAPPLLKSNLMIALGDLIVCWNTVIDNEVHVLYDALKTRQDPSVKKNALMVLLHLILNGMVKVKGHLSSLAMCLEDKDEKIAGLTRLFLSELAGKEQALYNNLSDALSHLLMFKSNGGAPLGKDSADAKKKKRRAMKEDQEDDEDADSMDVDAADDAEDSSDADAQEDDEGDEESADEGAVKRVLKFLFSFISKDKQVENLIEKLCARLKESEQPRQWRAIAYALSLLPWDTNPEPKCRKLLENFGVFTDKLGEEAVYKSVKDVIAKATRGTTGIGASAAATKASGAGAVPLIEELSKRVEKAREEEQE
ncbi:non-SMC mitotic condensation complex subunit 1-domain-containing protein [Catenaria anguillulae PL171]|uniref:Non-SMC mitotic condensation complex subunit 1-domain-containing protein n=1 Tax=Catenaria anguillulae PL171 TaxID=765915 RepID=A0A1Y2H704_9FUNG|nr:non-SMC mitotic condensation complex subunit 1-domain-containing protein [Catenaria anguillulae PL171]